MIGKKKSVSWEEVGEDDKVGTRRSSADEWAHLRTRKKTLHRGNSTAIRHSISESTLISTYISQCWSVESGEAIAILAYYAIRI